jgi:putative transposase
MGKRRGQLTTGSERQTILSLVKEATDAGARQKMACEMIGISAKTQQRWSQSSNDKDGRIEAPHSPQNKLTALERQRILKVVNEPDFAHLPASQIVPRLADKGIYIGSESTIYRILKEEKQLQHRLKSKPARKIIKPKALTAIAPNQVYTWDITYLPTRVKGTFFYLYLVLDIFSRKIVGWQVHCDELSALAADLMTDICLREKVKRHQVTLHSDNGSPYSESIFRTLKYRPEYPEKAFSDIDEARKWVTGFTKWYNEEHRHSGIKFVTPSERHQRIDDAILLNRVEVYNRAKAQNPSRWSGEIKNWDPIKEVNLNPEKSKIEIKENKAA